MIWAVMQQFLLQIYFLLRFSGCCRVRWPGSGRGPLIRASPFTQSGADADHPVWGIAACMLFLRYRNIYALGIAHGILGLCVAVIVPEPLQHHMRVGIGYYRYHVREHRQPAVDHRSQTDQIVSTDAWVMAEAPTRRS